MDEILYCLCLHCVGIIDGWRPFPATAIAESLGISIHKVRYYLTCLRQRSWKRKSKKLCAYNRDRGRWWSTVTREDKEAILNSFDEIMIQPDELMNFKEMKTYLKGFEDARNVIFDAIDKFYRNNKTD